MKALKIVYRDPRDLKPDTRNVRKHSTKQIELIRKSIREYGFTNPILLKKNGIIGAGHARHQAAIAEEVPRVPTITLGDLTPKQWRAYMIADNNLAAVGSTWDKDMLAKELTALGKMKIDLGDLGFTKTALATLGVAGFEMKDGDLAATNIIGEMSYAVIIRCKTEKQQTELLARFAKEGLECEALIS